MVGAKLLTSPTISGTKLSSFDCEVLSNPTDYKHIIGALQYCTITRLDISYVVDLPIMSIYASTKVVILVGYEKCSTLFKRNNK